MVRLSQKKKQDFGEMMEQVTLKLFQGAPGNALPVSLQIKS